MNHDEYIGNIRLRADVAPLKTTASSNYETEFSKMINAPADPADFGALELLLSDVAVAP